MCTFSWPATLTFIIFLARLNINWGRKPQIEFFTKHYQNMRKDVAESVSKIRM